MPLHPVPIIIGTTLAVISSGYAFKKFIYDPHLAPLIEALLAQHSIGSQPEYRPIPVPLSSPSYGSSTSRQHHQTHLRRRSHAHHRRPSHRVEDLHEDSWRPPSYELNESSATFSQRASYRRRKSSESTRPPKKNGVDMNTPLVDLDEPLTRQEGEVRQIIFNYAPTPQKSGATSPTHRSLDEFNIHASPPGIPDNLSPGVPGDLSVPSIPDPAVSTTFSFLSLSQQSSPEHVHSALECLSLGMVAENLVESREDDVLSLPDTEANLSGYEDAESYSPVSRTFTPALVSPTRSAPESINGSLGLADVEDPASAMGLNCMLPPSRSRGPMSVVSIGESEEGYKSESDWEAVESEVER